MKTKIAIDIKTCNGCPYHNWDADHSEGNDSGVSECKKAQREIQWNTKYPKIPTWCPIKSGKKK